VVIKVVFFILMVVGEGIIGIMMGGFLGEIRNFGLKFEMMIVVKMEILKGFVSFGFLVDLNYQIYL
jgi:hypothetical protein